LKKKVKKSFETVEHAFLQFADPPLKQKIDELVQKGVKKIIIFPFFIGSGSHILVDIPEMITQAQSKYSDVDFMVTRHLGKIEAVEDVIIREVVI